MMPTRNEGSPSIHSNALCSSQCPSVFMQLRSLGLLSVIRAMCGAGKEMVLYLRCGGAFVKVERGVGGILADWMLLLV